MIAFTREEAQQVLDALDFHSAGDEVDMKLISMLRYRLKQSTHASDCAVHNKPAYPAGECDCARLSAPEPVPTNNGRYLTGYGAQPEPEPVAWFTEDHREDKSATTYSKKMAERWKEKGWPVTPLYTAPPQRGWQSLTDEEKNEITWGKTVYEILDLAEAKLKEKNT